MDSFDFGFFLVGIILLVAIVIAFTMSCYWNVRFILISKKEDDEFRWIKIHIAIASALMSVVYAIVLILSFTEIRTSFSLGGFIVRPAMCYMACTVAGAARARYLARERNLKIRMGNYSGMDS